ncbi:MAG: hypothetical protein GF383_00245 [Candidatus Lokiarchaeota archaeon]|nr:hypothetical protein [Candidatus Lokiarchaeota archaeon]MBD3337524.1 hypothetical protein [Candidatus Lokiarchaeota archaeon]
MKKLGIDIVRMAICLVLGAIAGVICAIGTATAPIPAELRTIEFLLYVWYNRLMLGFILGFADNITIIKNDYGNVIIRGAVIGGVFSLLMVIPAGISAISYLYAGIIFAIIIDLIATKFGGSE